jgi:hypothetical protein
LGRRIEATDDRGTPAGEFEPRTLRRGGTLRWGRRPVKVAVDDTEMVEPASCSSQRSSCGGLRTMWRAPPRQAQVQIRRVDPELDGRRTVGERASSNL